MNDTPQMTDFLKDHGLTLTRLGYLRSMGRSRSMTAAAEAESISLPTLSHELSEIEARLAAPLCDRSRRTVVLNQAGRFLAAQAAEILDRLEKVAAETKDIAEREAEAAAAKAAEIKAAQVAAQAVAASDASDAILESLKGKTIAVEDPIARNPDFVALAKRLGLRVRGRSNGIEASDIWPFPNQALIDGKVDFLLEWHGEPRAWGDGTVRGVLIGEDPFEYVLVRDDDPLAKKKSVGLASLRRRRCDSVDMIRDRLLGKLMTLGLDHLPFIDLERTFAGEGRRSCAIVPASIGKRPPSGYVALPCKALATSASIYLKLRSGVPAVEIESGHWLGAALRGLLL